MASFDHAPPLPRPPLSGPRVQVCVASGRIVRDGNVVRCRTCKHLSITHELRGNTVCPLCHSALPTPAGGAGGPPGRTVSSKAAQMSHLYAGY